jgi:hypothetical protein
MQDDGLHDLRQAVDALVAAVAELDLTDASAAECEDLWVLLDRLEARSRALMAEAATLADASTLDVRGDPDGLSHPLRRVES